MAASISSIAGISGSWPRRAPCDRLVVGLDGSDATSQGQCPIRVARASVLTALEVEAVDLVVVFDEDTPCST